MTTKEVAEIRIIWDTQGDPENWAERVTYSDGSQDSGPCCWEPSGIDDLPTAVVETAAVCGVTSSPDEVAFNRYCEGGFAIWTRSIQQYRRIEL